MKEQHSESENRTELYEDVLLGKKLWTRLYRKLFWNGVSKKQIVKAMLKYIPEDFKGRLLDVPAGTGLFTYRKYSWMRDARIICYDEDEEMLDLAKKRFARDAPSLSGRTHSRRRASESSRLSPTASTRQLLTIPLQAPRQRLAASNGQAVSHCWLWSSPAAEPIPADLWQTYTWCRPALRSHAPTASLHIRPRR